MSNTNTRLKKAKANQNVVYATQSDNKVEVTIYSGDKTYNTINTLVLRAQGLKKLRELQSA